MEAPHPLKTNIIKIEIEKKKKKKREPDKSSWWMSPTMLI